MDTFFTIIDIKTGEDPDVVDIALTEDWAKHLVYCDIEGFAITEYGTLVLMDECGNVAYCPEGRFKVTFTGGRLNGVVQDSSFPR